MDAEDNPCLAVITFLVAQSLRGLASSLLFTFNKLLDYTDYNSLIYLRFIHASSSAFLLWRPPHSALYLDCYKAFKIVSLLRAISSYSPALRRDFSKAHL